MLSDALDYDLLVMPDFTATGLWKKTPRAHKTAKWSRVPVELSRLKLPIGLQRAIENWQSWYDSNAPYLEEHVGMLTEEQMTIFTRDAVAIAVSLKQLFPTQTIALYDEFGKMDRVYLKYTERQGNYYLL